MSWLRAIWSRLRFRRRLAPLALPAGIVVADVRLVVHRAPNGAISYLLRDADGQPASSIAFSNLLSAVADMGCSMPGIVPSVRKACKKLDLAMGALRARARREIDAGKHDNGT